jgi:hypothetical protein
MSVVLAFFQAKNMLKKWVNPEKGAMGLVVVASF